MNQQIKKADHRNSKHCISTRQIIVAINWEKNTRETIVSNIHAALPVVNIPVICFEGTGGNDGRLPNKL